MAGSYCNNTFLQGPIGPPQGTSITDPISQFKKARFRNIKYVDLVGLLRKEEGDEKRNCINTEEEEKKAFTNNFLAAALSDAGPL